MFSKQTFHVEQHIISAAAAKARPYGIPGPGEMQSVQATSVFRGTDAQMHDKAMQTLNGQGAASWMRISVDGKGWRSYSVRTDGRIEMNGRDLRLNPNGTLVLTEAGWKQDVGWGPGIAGSARPHVHSRPAGQEVS